MTFWTAQCDKKQFLAYTLMEVFENWNSVDGKDHL